MALSSIAHKLLLPTIRQFPWSLITTRQIILKQNTMSQPTYQNLVEILGLRPPIDASATTIDFEKLGFPEYKDHFAIVVDNLFSKSECQVLLQAAEKSTAQGWEPAMVNIGLGQQKMMTDIRLCDRILWDEHEIAEKILDRVMPYLPAHIVTLKARPLITGRGPVKRKEVWKISRMNERLRFLKYTKGMYFREHCDGSYITPDQKEITFLTVHLYLNGDSPVEPSGAEKDEDKPLLGGATRFFSMDTDRHWDLNPKTGSVLVFQHRNLLHSGDDVRQGTKFTMRSDILYQKVDNES